MPKRSGVLRPYSLLTIEDQIVYQALVNIVAEQLHPKVSRAIWWTLSVICTQGKVVSGFIGRWSEGYKKIQSSRPRWRGLRRMMISGHASMRLSYENVIEMAHAVVSFGANASLR